MSSIITKEFMYHEVKKILLSLFNLPELERVVIKGVEIPSLEDEHVISSGVNECFHDMYSDIDIQIEIKLNHEEYNRNSPIYADCLRRLGFENDILGMSYHSTEERGEVIRLCKTNGMRFDLIINAICEDGISQLPHQHVEENLRKVDNFWFVAILALGKLMRRDYLISSHLAHMLIQEGLVMQMEMRDNEKKANFHRFGYKEELYYLTLLNKEEVPFAKTSDETCNYISRLLYSAVKSYDELYFSIDNSYKSRLKNYLDIWACYCEI